MVVDVVKIGGSSRVVKKSLRKNSYGFQALPIDNRRSTARIRVFELN